MPKCFVSKWEILKCDQLLFSKAINMAPLCFQWGAAGMVVKVTGTERANFSPLYKQNHFTRQKRPFFELSLLQATPEGVISLCNEMSSDMVKTLEDARTLCQHQETSASAKREQCKVLWELLSWLLSINDWLDTILVMVKKYSEVKYFKWYADFESSLCLIIWLNGEGHSFLYRECVCLQSFTLLLTNVEP